MKKLLILLFVICYLLFVISPVYAASECKAPSEGFNLMVGISDQCYCTGDCSFCDILRVFVNVARLILISVGGIALILFLWGGTGLILNWGNPEAINKGKRLFLHTFLGIIFVLAAWTLVNLLFNVLARPTPSGGETGWVLQKEWNWWNPPICQ